MKGFRDSLRLWKISIPKQIPGFFLGPSWDWNNSSSCPGSIHVWYLYLHEWLLFYEWVGIHGFACLFGAKTMVPYPLKTSGSDFKAFPRFPCGIWLASSQIFKPTFGSSIWHPKRSGETFFADVKNGDEQRWPYSDEGPWNESLNFIFPTKYVMPKSFKVGH